MEDKGKMDELIEQMKLMNERLGNVEKMLEESIYHQHRTDFTSEYLARQQGYTGFINEDIALAPKPPSRLFGNHFIKITDARLGEAVSLKAQGKTEGTCPKTIDRIFPGKRWGSIDTGVYDIHDYRENMDRHPNGHFNTTTCKAHYLQSLTEDDTEKEDFVWLSGDIKFGEEIERRPFKEGEARVLEFRPRRSLIDVIYDETNLTEVEITHRVPVLTEANDLGGEMRRAKAAAEEKEKQERLNREEKEKQERLVREELEKKRKYEEDLRNRTERGEKFEFTPEQLHEIVNNTPEGQKLLQEKKRRLEEEAGGVPREDSRVASLAKKVDEDLVVAEASSVGGEENT